MRGHAWTLVGAAVATLPMLASCEPPGPEHLEKALQEMGAVDAPEFNLATAEIVDLSHPFDEETIYWPTAPYRFELEELHFGRTEAGFFYAANAFCTPEHGGTHLDAPIHFAEGRRSVDEIPLRQLIAPLVVIDVREAAAADRNHRLSRERVEAWEQEHGPIPQGAVVVLRTGWWKRWLDVVAYLGDDTPGDASNLSFPSYGEDAAVYLVEDRRVGALGVDTASIDTGRSQDFPVHRLAAEAHVPGLENLTNLDQVPPTGAWVVALPMKIRGGSGAPVRVAALVPR